MTKSQKDLLLLLRAALWNDTEAAQRIHDANWEEIALLAKEQTVIGICGDAIAMLDKEQCPGTELKTKWAGWMLQTERHNERMNHAAAAITHGFKKYGLDRDADYDSYFRLQNQIVRAYTELRNGAAKKKYGVA